MPADETLDKAMSQQVFGKVDQQLIMMVFAMLVKNKGPAGMVIDHQQFKEFTEAAEPIDLIWEIDNAEKRITFKTVPPISQ